MEFQLLCLNAISYLINEIFHWKVLMKFSILFWIQFNLIYIYKVKKKIIYKPAFYIAVEKENVDVVRIMTESDKVDVNKDGILLFSILV